MQPIKPGSNYDVLIVGGGILGLASAYYATARGLSTLIVDQYGVRNDVNSSKGVERMFRLMQDNESETRLAEASLALWTEIQLAAGTRLLAMDDLLFFGHRDAPMTTEGNVAQVRKTMDGMGMPYEYLDSPAAIHRRFPIFNLAALPDDYVGLVQAASASINVQAASRTFLLGAKRTGRLHVLDGQTVVHVDHHQQAADCAYTLHTRSDDASMTVHGRHLIACPGVWADSVLRGLGLKQSGRWKIWQMNYAYWELKASHPRMPIWFEFGNVDASDRGTFYGFPRLDFSPAMHDMVKMSADYTYDVFDEPSAIRSTVSDRLMRELTEHVGRLVDPDVIDASHGQHAGTCLYSMSPDGKLVIGRIPMEPRSKSYHARASMCIMESGRAFKYAPLFGRVLVELAVDGHSRYQSDLDIFSPTRDGLFDSLIR
ncbi:FAD-dependent oxidoreductase [Burkholderia oklahomensis]|uniref:FAD-dependent oxidoreductase n=1 Tax=Burkholderia oklahomensis TaxID=342113 RepID=UPI002656ACB8|nr:FAD-dependent oxidoreductase [Burkholderia oklahomensis]MDN7671427.1 FAD-dependent oxidoreductase [Burkholderia oklahomensis]